MAKQQKIRHFEDGGPADGGDNTSSAFNNNNTTNDNNNTTTDNTNDNTSTTDKTSDTSPFAVMSTGFQQTPENARALANSTFSSGFKSTEDNQQALKDQQTVRDFLAKVQADKETAKTKPGEFGNFSDPNIGTNVTNALQAALDSGVNVQHFTRQMGKSGTEKDITSTSTNIPIARFLGYTGDPGNSAISYGEAKMLQSLKQGDLSGVHLGNMTGTGLSVANAEGNPWSGVTSENIGQTANGIVAATDFGNFAEKVIDVAKHFVPGYGLIEMAANLLSGKLSFGDMVMGIGLNKIAPALQMSPRMLSNIINMDAGNIMTDAVIGKVVKDLSSELGVHPALVVTGLKETGSLEGLSKMLGIANVNANTTGKLSNAITNAASNVGVSFGQNESVGVPTSIGDSQQEQIDRYIGNGYQKSCLLYTSPSPRD